MSGEMPEDDPFPIFDPTRIPPKSFAQNIPAPIDDFAEDPPCPAIGHNSSCEAFFEAARGAELLEHEIAAIEENLDHSTEDANSRLQPLTLKQIIVAFEMAELIQVRLVPAAQVETYLIDSGVADHGNATVPFSRLMRAVTRSNESRTQAVSKRKRARATTYASAVDYALTLKMTKDQFIAEVTKPRISGERHGIEHLAREGKRMRRSLKREQAARTAAVCDHVNFTAEVAQHPLQRQFNDVTREIEKYLAEQIFGDSVEVVMRVTYDAQSKLIAVSYHEPSPQAAPPLPAPPEPNSPDAATPLSVAMQARNSAPVVAPRPLPTAPRRSREEDIAMRRTSSIFGKPKTNASRPKAPPTSSRRK